MAADERPGAGETTVAVVVQALRARLLSGDLEPGQRLTTEGLATELGVSRVPIREALRQLAGQGLVDITDRRGARVVDAPSIEPLLDLLRVRRQLEPWAASEAATHRSPVDLDAMAGFVAAGEAAGAAGDRAAAAQAHHDLLLAILSAGGNEVLVQTGRPLVDRTMVVFRRLPAGALPDGWAAHRRTVDAIAAGDRRAASAAVRHHLDEVISALDRLPQT